MNTPSSKGLVVVCAGGTLLLAALSLVLVSQSKERSSLSTPHATDIVAVAESDSDAWLNTMESAHDALHAGEYHRAKQLFAEALAATEGFDNADPRRAETKVELAESLLALGELARCEQLCIESIGALERQYGEKQMQIAQAEKVLTRMYVHLGMYRLADQHCSHGLKVSESILGKRHPDVVEFQAWMRHIWNICSGYGDANGIGGSLPILEASLGKSDPRLIVALEALAGDCYHRWTPAQAARAVSIAESTYGKRNPVYGSCLSTLATAHRNTRDFEKSEVISKQAIEVLSNSLGPDHPQLSAAYRNLASIELERGRLSASEARYRDSIRLRFSTLGDADLCHFFDQLVDSGQDHSYDGEIDDVSEMFLREMIRRGGAAIQEFLTQKIETLRQKYLLASKELEQVVDSEIVEDYFAISRRMERYSQNLELVTALCRIQKRPDPLRIAVEGPQELTCEFPEMPEVDATIRNVDTEKREIGFTESGDYRSGRQARWRIEVTDAAEKVRSPKQLHGIIMGGGLYQPTTLKPGAGWQTSLTMARFVETLEPGEYQVRVLYHNELKIVDREFTAGLIVSQSEPIKLTVNRRSIQVANSQLEEITELLERFDDRQKCKIVDGKYGPWAHKFVDPKSEYGRLLTLGWSAVPKLIEELNRERVTPNRRAHLLALLFSITGENDPRPQDLIRNSPAIGSYSVLEGGWSVTSKRAGEDQPGAWSSGFTAGPSTHDSKLETEAQALFVNRWHGFKQYLEVTLTD